MHILNYLLARLKEKEKEQDQGNNGKRQIIILSNTSTQIIKIFSKKYATALLPVKVI